MFTGLAIKYRPKKFRQVIGQPDIPVIKAVLTDRDSLPPLLLFCGPSGVGKTTTARIIAAFLNCTSLDESGEPCSRCDSCRAATDGQLTNVYELDAASHGTADQLRELVVKAHLSSSSTKLFILDEAQSISSQGWNVLLKVLEEPPSDCMFILVTSEPRKVPSKIRTRALRFNFKPMAPKKLKWYLSELVKHCDLQVSSTDLDIIVDLSEGSVREAMMMLDQCRSSKSSAQQLFADKNLSLQVISSILSNNYAGTLLLVDKWWGEVGEAKTILSQLASTFESLVLKKSGSEDFMPAIKTEHAKLADSISSDKLVELMLTVSDWFPQTYSKAQIVMLVSKMYKTLNGDHVTLETPVVVKQEVSASLPTNSITEKFSNL